MMNNIIRLRRRTFTYRSKGKKSIADEPEAQALVDILTRNPRDPGNLHEIIKEVFQEQRSSCFSKLSHQIAQDSRKRGETINHPAHDKETSQDDPGSLGQGLKPGVPCKKFPGGRGLTSAKMCKSSPFID